MVLVKCRYGKVQSKHFMLYCKTGFLQELIAVHQPASSTAVIQMEVKLLELAVKKWSHMEPPGNSFSTQMQKDVSFLVSLPYDFHCPFQSVYM